ncbi:MAG: DUF2203 domain-containing protein [Immundisolibacter sp.]|uniref:DUF2203 domain-containing protein n=2 Tax=Immundisolibacter sp. TaxID=1934948 RepID=UPI00356878CB
MDIEFPRIGSPQDPRVFSLTEAQALFPLVRSITQRAAESLVPVQRQLKVLPRGSQELANAEQRYQAAVNAWLNKIRRLGLVVKGLWLVDFDTGDGYLCWKYPELTLGHYHGYDEGFSGRKPLIEVLESLDPDWARY